MSSEDRLTFLDDKVILIISSLGLVLISTVVFWVARQSTAVGGGVPRAEEDEAGLLGGRTRVVPGGREALKAARKEAKKRAKAEFKESSAGLKRRSRVHERKRPPHVGEEQSRQGDARKRSPAELLRQLEKHILDNKVSSLETLETELSLPSAEIAVKIEELEARGAFKGIMIDDARGRGESGRSFVRVSDEELRTLATIIDQRGRLTVADFAAEANRVLQLSMIDGGEEAGRNEPEDQCMLDCQVLTEPPSDGCRRGHVEERIELSPNSSR
eukprot:g11746.t1